MILPLKNFNTNFIFQKNIITLTKIIMKLNIQIFQKKLFYHIIIQILDTFILDFKQKNNVIWNCYCILSTVIYIFFLFLK